MHPASSPLHACSYLPRIGCSTLPAQRLSSNFAWSSARTFHNEVGLSSCIRTSTRIRSTDFPTSVTLASQRHNRIVDDTRSATHITTGGHHVLQVLFEHVRNYHSTANGGARSTSMARTCVFHGHIDASLRHETPLSACLAATMAFSTNAAVRSSYVIGRLQPVHSVEHFRQPRYRGGTGHV